MPNDRGAGRKPKLTSQQMDEIRLRLQNGESVAVLAQEAGISRQALYQRLRKERQPSEIVLEVSENGQPVSVIYADPTQQKVRLSQYSTRLSGRPFGFNESPSWEQFRAFLEERIIIDRCGGDSRRPMAAEPVFLCEDRRRDTFSAEELPPDIRVTQTVHPMPLFAFSRKDLLYTRSDTDGFQVKAMSRDHRWFIKSQAVLAQKPMEDWKVEVLASEIARMLDIPCVQQFPCHLAYAGQRYMGVYSANFELDGYSFISFERLLGRSGQSLREDAFLQADPADKLIWCAQKLAEVSGLPYEQTEKYMLDLAVLDCLTGNVDRHGHNFGLFWQAHTQQFEIPLIFDNGMGLFEHDYYKDTYQTCDEAMRTVYIGPYDEDPFDLIRILAENWDLKTIYPGLSGFSYPKNDLSAFALEYESRMMQCLSHLL